MSNGESTITSANPVSVSPYSIASGEIGEQRLGHLRARWLARNMLWSSLPHEPRTGDLSPISLEAFLSHYREHGQSNWAVSDDRLTRLLKFASPTIEQLLENLRTSIRRSHSVRRPHQVRELDGRCMEWLGRQPGRHVREKIAVARGCLSVERIWTAELVENRVLISLALRLAKLAECYAGRLDKEELSELYASAVSWRTKLRREEVDHLRLTEPAMPNNVLLSHRQYSIVWRAWERLRGFDELYGLDLESDPASNWCDLMVVALAAQLDQHPNVRMVHRVVRPPCVLRSGGANARLHIETDEVRFIHLTSDVIRDLVLQRCDQSSFVVKERIGSASETLIVRQWLRFNKSSVFISSDQKQWRPIGHDPADVDRVACELAEKLVGSYQISPKPTADVSCGTAIGCQLFARQPIVLRDRLDKPITLPLASGVVEGHSEEDGQSVSYRSQSGKHIIDRATNRWLRLADLLGDSQADPVAFAPVTKRLSEILQQSEASIFAYGMPDSFNEFKQSRLRMAMATSFRQPIPVWHSIALAEALQHDSSIEPNQDDVLVVVDLSGDHPCLTVLTRAEDAWEHHPPIFDERSFACGDRRLVHNALISNAGSREVDRDLIDEILSHRKDHPKASAAKPMLESGMVLDGVVTRIADYCVFVDLGKRRTGRILVRDLADRFVKHPSEIVRDNERVLVKVLDVDHQKSRFRLSRVKLRDLTSGMLLKGVLTRATKAGRFVDVGIGTEGLLHEDRQSSETFQLNQELPVKVEHVDLKNNRFTLTLHQGFFVLNRFLRLAGKVVTDLTEECKRVVDCASENEQGLVQSLDELCSSARLRDLVRSITNRRKLRSVSVVLASHCYPIRMHKQILQPVLRWTESLRCERLLPTIVKLRHPNDQIAIGCQRIAHRSHSNQATWYECLPPLAFEVVKDGHFHHCGIIDGERVEPHQAHRQAFRSVPGFTIPAGVSEPRLPLLTGEFGELPYGMEARLNHRALPLNNDCPCTLHLSYDYQSESPYRLEFVPEKPLPGVSRLTAQWAQSELTRRRNCPYPMGHSWDFDSIQFIDNNCQAFLKRKSEGDNCWGWLSDKGRRNFLGAMLRQSRSVDSLPDTVRLRLKGIAYEARDLLILNPDHLSLLDQTRLAAIVEMVLEDEAAPTQFDLRIKALLTEGYSAGLAMCLLGNGQAFRAKWLRRLVEDFGKCRSRDVTNVLLFSMLALSRALWRRPSAIDLLDNDSNAAGQTVRMVSDLLRFYLQKPYADKRSHEMLGYCFEIVLALCRRVEGDGAIARSMRKNSRSDELLSFIKRLDEYLFSKNNQCVTKMKFGGTPMGTLRNMSPIAYNIVASLGGEQFGDLLEITDVG